MALTMKNPDHIGINTLDIEESVRYYTDVFGFREIKRADMGDLTLVYMDTGTDMQLELFDLRGNVIRGDIPEAKQGFRHIAFYVDDIKAWEEHLKEKGAEFTMELTRLPQLERDGILVRDPNGLIIELTAAY